MPAPSYLQRCPLAALAGPLPIDPHAHRCDLQDGSGYLIDVETHACKELWGLEGCQVGGEHRARAAALLPVGYPKCVPSPLAWPGSLLFHVLCSAARQSARPFCPPQNWLVAPVWYRVCGSFDHKESVEEYDMVRDMAVWQLSGVPMLMAWRVGSSSPFTSLCLRAGLHRRRGRLGVRGLPRWPQAQHRLGARRRQVELQEASPPPASSLRQRPRLSQACTCLC